MRRPGIGPWRAVRDERGQWQVTGPNGSRPLRSSDPLERLLAAHLAAAAPELRDVLERMTRRMEHLIGTSSAWKMDEKLVQEGWGTVIYSRPHINHIMEAISSKGQRELELDPEEAQVQEA